jgi:OOP family OmpA-OmpF porin
MAEACQPRLPAPVPEPNAPATLGPTGILLLPKRLIAKLPFPLPEVLPKHAIAGAAFVTATVIALLAAWISALMIETRTEQAVTSRLLDQGLTWASVDADGLQIRIIGTAPNEAARFRAINIAGSVVDAARVRDQLEVTPVMAIAAPRFSLEMLRNDDGIQLIGLLPKGAGVDRLKGAAATLSPDTDLSDMLETADYPAPGGWDAAFDYGLGALELLPRSKVSVSSDRVVITAIADSAAEQRKFEADLARTKPDELAVVIDITAPRPVLTPFTLRFVLDDQGARFDACSADTDRARDRILAAGAAAGVQGKVTCTVGLGVPSPSWADAAAAGIAAVKELAEATVTFSDADVSLVAADSVDQADFDRVLGELQTALPPVFSLNATLERTSTAAAAGPAEFTATLSKEGRVELRGRVTDALLRDAVTSFAKAHFGVANVYNATRLDEGLPDGWPVRVLAGLESLGELAEGRLVVQADLVTVQGITGSLAARGRISQVLSDKLGQGETFRVAVVYDEALDPLAALPTPQECADQVRAVMASNKITFPPGSAEIDNSTGAIMDALTGALTDCVGLRMEIAGYTDSQGSDSGNRALSQARAEAVLVALQGRGVDVSAMQATGYGEADPIADNGTEAGRDANRRIEFVLRDTSETTAAPGGTTGTVGGADAATADVPGDDSPSFAPAEMTRRPLARPARDG